LIPDRSRCPYNFVRIHKTLRTTPAMAAGVTTYWRLYDPFAGNEFVVAGIDTGGQSIVVGGVMLNARECRRQAAVCRAEARVTESVGASTTLTAMARSWAMLARQMDRLQAIRDHR
jgi:hypothetical protein